MSGEKDLFTLLQNMEPELQPGQYVFVSAKQELPIKPAQILATFREKEGTTYVLEKSLADKLQLSYDYVAGWITLNVHSALEAVGLTAAFANALAEEGISCNVMAGYYHDHIFVDEKEAAKAIDVLHALSKA